jgi:hypothetical protein
MQNLDLIKALQKALKAGHVHTINNRLVGISLSYLVIPGKEAGQLLAAAINFIEECQNLKPLLKEAGNE